MPLNTQQKEAAQHFMTSSQSMVVEARAGSGKTSWILALSKIPKTKTKNVIFVAFTNAAKDELIRREPAIKDKVKTLYQIGFQACKRLIDVPRIEVDKNKYFQIMDEVLNLENISRMAKDNHLPLGYQSPYIKELNALASLALVNLCFDRLSLDDFLERNFKLNKSFELEVLQKVISKGIKKCKKGNIGFSDMVSYPFHGGFTDEDLEMAFDGYDVVFLDEAQDTSPAQLSIVSRIVKDQLVAIGDPYQCQPEGTLVTCVKAGKNQKFELTQVLIENLKEGDQVLSPVLRDSHNYRGTVLKTAKRHYNGNLKVAIMGEKVSKYTPNHKVLVNFKSFIGKQYVYLMQQGDLFRIGKSEVKSTNEPKRWTQECSEKTWILGFYDNDNEARDAELTFAWTFGIPTQMFEERQNVRYDGVLNRFWKSLPPLTNRAKECLESVGLDIDYPLFNHTEKSYNSFKRPFYTFASNLVSGVLMLPYNGSNKFKSSDWEQVVIEDERYQGFVYSLEVDREVYYADGIATHNCIFGFAGSTGNSLDLIREKFNAKSFTFPVCYRCGDSIIKEAQKIVPDIEGVNKTSIVERVYSFEEARDLVNPKEDWLVICRTNAPLVKLAVEWLRQRVPFKFNRSNVEDGIKSKLSYYKSQNKDFDSIYHALEVDEKISVKYRNGKSLDLINCIKEVIKLNPEINSWADLRSKVREIFRDSNATVILGSIHSFKGSEADNVLFYREEQIPFFLAQSEIDIQQEWNLYYVGVTRAKKRLVFYAQED